MIFAAIAIATSSLATPMYAGNNTPTDTDTVFKKTNPNLLYTTRDYFISIPDNCYGDEFCLSGFSLILTFNIGIDSKQVVKQIGFHSADLDLASKPSTGKTFVDQDFSQYKPVSSENGWKLNLAFFPDKTTATAKGAITKCVFDGTVGQKGVSGKVIFYTADGTFEMTIN
jgi:hypothetical protein